MIYLDNAATSWPKPPGVADAMMAFLHDVGANPGRSGHRLSIAAGRIVNDAREALAERLGCCDPFRVVFGMNATEAINLVLHGLLEAGDHVVTSSMEHNAVMRPLRRLEERGIRLSVAPCSSQGLLDPAEVDALIRPATRLLVINHASNVIGTIQPVREIARLARRKGVLLLVDAAASAGSFPIHVEEDQIDLLAFTGHKALGGPTGTGGLVLGERVDPEWIAPLMQGGTGSRSEEEHQPRFLPDVYESGTLNATGLAGLLAGVRWLAASGMDAVRSRAVGATQTLIDGLMNIPGVTVYGTHDAHRQVATLSFNVAGMSPSEVGQRLDEEHGVLCRVGLHCAPAAHRTIGTAPQGTVRFAPGPFTAQAELAAAIDAVRALARR
jgi:cysteine desulfurase / selenocysteine lyase